MARDKKLTIYDVIPHIEKEVMGLLESFLKADNRKFHLWEMAVFIPACNTFIHNMSGVNDSLRSDNYISAITNYRSAIESLAAVAFDGSAQLTEKEYERFLKKGRFYRYDEVDTEWREVGPRTMVSNAEKVLGIKLLKTYDECCSTVHFSANHMGFLTRFTSQQDRFDSKASVLIGSKDKIPVAEQKKLIEATVELATQLGRCIHAATLEKTNRNTS